MQGPGPYPVPEIRQKTDRKAETQNHMLLKVCTHKQCQGSSAEKFAPNLELGFYVGARGGVATREASTLTPICLHIHVCVLSV